MLDNSIEKFRIRLKLSYLRYGIGALPTLDGREAEFFVIYDMFNSNDEVVWDIKYHEARILVDLYNYESKRYGKQILNYISDVKIR